MLGSLNQLFSWTTSKTKQEWDTWELWQRSQPLSHFSKSDAYHHYVNYRKQFRPLNGSCGTNDCYCYCFGNYASLLVLPSANNDITTYAVLLLDFYDVNKGVSRRMITGDPSGIVVLREAVLRHRVNKLREHDFAQYAYDYTTVHGHTVAQYSLSTLIMRMIANYLALMYPQEHYPTIDVGRCRDAMNSQSIYRAPLLSLGSASSGVTRSLGSITTPSVHFVTHPSETNSSEKNYSDNIIIPHKFTVEQNYGLSWPCDVATRSKCGHCSRITERTWGRFNACMDCHMKRICSLCGKEAVIISDDDLPRCKEHQDE